MQRTCVKCGFKNPATPTGDDDACPGCGAVYAKAMPTSAKPVPAHAPRAGFGASSSFGSAAIDKPHHVARHMSGEAALVPRDFVESMREQSLYPAMRTLTKWVFFLMMLTAALIALGGLRSMFGSSEVGTWVGISALGGAAFLAVVSLVMREAVLMLADLSDAAVRLAASSSSSSSASASTHPAATASQ